MIWLLAGFAAQLCLNLVSCSLKTLNHACAFGSHLEDEFGESGVRRCFFLIWGPTAFVSSW